MLIAKGVGSVVTLNNWYIDIFGLTDTVVTRINFTYSDSSRNEGILECPSTNNILNITEYFEKTHDYAVKKSRNVKF